MSPALLLWWLSCVSDGPRPRPPPSFDSPDAAQRGRALFVRHCAICHGVTGDGRGRRRQALSAPPRDFTQPRWIERQPPEALFRVIRDGKRGTSMPAWGGTLRDGQVWDVASYLRTIPRDGSNF